jgi:diaminohydroxyphosphoribosylaminopyrimidine deaminase/5-amino-6-(5-phosphoribosylamino)uracil reductase
MKYLKNDIYYMRRAIAMARKAIGRTSPNPLVGCVIVKSGKVIAEGWHKFCGGAHAEVDALKKAGTGAKGATMYVNLEPCSHWGRTPPCVEAILKAGIKKVVVAMVDPNPVNNGKSLRILQAKGVKVVTGVCEEEAKALNTAFVKYITTRMPFVTAKTAQTLDGKIATSKGDSKWITAEATRAFATKKRDEFDAILVGINTVLADDPRLNAPSKHLWKIVVDSKLRTPERARIFLGADPGQVILATTKTAPKARVTRLQKRGARVIICPAKNGRVDLKWLFKELAKIGIASILIEGGAAVIGSALKAKLVDRLYVYIAPKIVGNERARGAVAGLDVVKISQAFRVRLTQVQKIGSDLFLTFNF